MLDISDDVFAQIERSFSGVPRPKIDTAKTIPLLIWISRAYSVDNSGKRTEYGPYFSAQWTDEDEIKQYDYFKFGGADRFVLALAPGDLFRSKFHTILQADDRFTLAPCE